MVSKPASQPPPQWIISSFLFKEKRSSFNLEPTLSDAVFEGVISVMVIVILNGLGDSSSYPGQRFLRFNIYLCLLGKS